MKTILSSLLICILGLSSSYAQEIRIAPVVGVNATLGIRSSDIKKSEDDLLDDLRDNDPDGDYKFTYLPNIGFQVGGLVDYSFNNSLTLQSGLLLHMRGMTQKFSMKGGNDNGKATVKTRISYLEVPLLASLNLGESGFKFVGGPSLGFAVSGKSTAKASNNGQKDKDSEKMDIGKNSLSDDVKPFDLSLHLGIAKELAIKGAPVQLSLFVQPSLTKWNPSSTISKDYWRRHMTLGLRAAYYFSIR